MTKVTYAIVANDVLCRSAIYMSQSRAYFPTFMDHVVCWQIHMDGWERQTSVEGSPTEYCILIRRHDRHIYSINFALLISDLQRHGPQLWHTQVRNAQVTRESGRILRNCFIWVHQSGAPEKETEQAENDQTHCRVAIIN